MALGAVLAAALTDHSARSKALYVGGVDVIAEPAVPARYGVPLQTVHIEEAAADGVSSMDFTIECSTALPVSVGDGMEVRFEDITAGRTNFLGWVDHVDIENMDGNVGTRFIIRCTGVEAALDWAILPSDVTIPAGTLPENAVLTLVGQAVGPVMGSLRAFAGTGGLSTDDGPVGNGFGALGNALTVSAGTTLREGIRQVTGQVTPLTFTVNDAIAATVDFHFGLRYYSASTISGGTGGPVFDDDPPLTFRQTEDLKYGIDAASVRGVIVKGSGITVTVMDGSGKPGSMALLSDTTITTAAAATAAATAYLLQYVSTARGTVSMLAFLNTAFAPADAAHAWRSQVIITDARVGLASNAFSVNTIQKTFLPGNLEDWVFSFGGRAPSVTQLTRQLTRTQLS